MARSLGEGIISGLKNYAAFNQTGQTKQMNDLKMLATMQRLKSMDTPTPAGYINYGGKLLLDKTSLPSQKLAQYKLEQLQSRPKTNSEGTTPEGYQEIIDPATGMPKVISKKYSPEEKLVQETQKKELATMASALPKLEQATQATGQLKELYGKTGKAPTVPQDSRMIGLASGLPGIVGRPIQGLGRTLSAWTGINPNLSQYLGNRKAFSGLLSKGAFGEAGMLTNDDINRIKNILPSEYTTQQQADIAWREIGEILTSSRKRYENKKAEFAKQSLPYPKQFEKDKKYLSTEFWDKNKEQGNVPSVGQQFNGEEILSVEKVG